MINNALELQARRKKIFDAMSNNSIAILSAAEICYRNNDTEYPYRQCSYFNYVTGWPEPSAVALLMKTSNRCQFILFCQPKDPAKEQWTGIRQGPEGACLHFLADEAYPIAELTEKMLSWLANVETMYTIFSINSPLEVSIRTWIDTLQKRGRQGVHAPHVIKDLRIILDERRLFKSPEEQQQIRTACEIASEGHRQAMRHCRPGLWEYEIEAVLLNEFYKRGSHYPAYTSIVAGGANACVLHYVDNADQLQDNSLLLIDAGAEYEGYASDITRTFPVNGRFNTHQQAVYECVLASQQAAIAAVRPGLPWNALQKIILEILVQGLVDLKVLTGDVNQLIAEKAYAPFYMHTSGHWLGCDVHDVGDYKVNNEWRALEAGMVFTVEPGLYFNPMDQKIPEALRGIGIRIEDDIGVTEKGYISFSDVPKTVKEIEQWMRAD